MGFIPEKWRLEHLETKQNVQLRMVEDLNVCDAP